MRINKIKDSSVDCTLNSDELVLLQNILYFYEQHHMEIKDTASPSKLFHETYAQIIMASNISQYGHMDNYATSQYVRHKAATEHPNGRLAVFNQIFNQNPQDE